MTPAAIESELAKPLKDLRCCICGDPTRGRQWHNRNTGYGICTSCADGPALRGFASAEETTAGMLRLYGVRGIHYAVDKLSSNT